jgi:hypothetical protein
MSGNNSSELILTNIHQDDLIERIAEAVVLRLESKSLTHSKEQEERKVTVDQAVVLLKASRPTLRVWEQKGILIPTRLGRRVYYLYSDIVKAGNKIKTA